MPPTGFSKVIVVAPADLRTARSLAGLFQHSFERFCRALKNRHIAKNYTNVRRFVWWPLRGVRRVTRCLKDIVIIGAGAKLAAVLLYYCLVLVALKVLLLVELLAAGSGLVSVVGVADGINELVAEGALEGLSVDDDPGGVLVVSGGGICGLLLELEGEVGVSGALLLGGVGGAAAGPDPLSSITTISAMPVVGALGTSTTSRRSSTRLEWMESRRLNPFASECT